MKKKLLSIICAGVLTTSIFVGCSSNGGESTGSTDSSGKKEEVTLKVLTHRTDIKDTVLKTVADNYYKEKGVKIEWEAITEYESIVQTRMNTQDYGDVLNILPAFKADELGLFFEPLGKVEDYKDYVGITQRADLESDTVYGLPNGLGADGIVYNKKVFAAAGYEEFPKTLDELYNALGKIKEQEGVVPVAINSADMWPLSQYDAVASVVYGNPYYYRDMGKMESPFSAGKPTGDVLEILYKFVSEGWVEQDLATTNWEQSKVDMANGKVGMMTLGMWAVSQIQGANEANADDIGIAPFPADNSGKLKAGAGPDNYLGVSKYSKHKEEAKDFAIYFANSLDYLDSNGFIPANKSLSSGNPVVKAYQDSGVELMFADPAEADQAASDLTTEIANESGTKFWVGEYIQNAVIAAKKSRADFEKVIEDYNTKWNSNKEKLSQ